MSEALITRRGGGAPLNFRINGGTSEPAAPKENDIWVNTAAPITGWEFKAVAPATPVEGMVWFRTSDNSAGAFNVLKKNGIWVYPTDCKQYVGGAWTVKPSKIFKSGAWRSFAQVLFNAGRPAMDWSSRGILWSRETQYYYRLAPTVTPLDGVTTLTIKSQTSGSHYQGVYELANDIDLTNYKTLDFDIAPKTFHNYPGVLRVGLFVFPRTAKFLHNEAEASRIFDNVEDESRHVYSLPLDNIVGLHDVGIGLTAYDRNTVSCDFYSCTLY